MQFGPCPSRGVHAGGTPHHSVHVRPTTAMSCRAIAEPRMPLGRAWAAALGFAGLFALAGCSGPTTRAPIVDGLNQSQATTPASSGSPTYVVKPGDTLHGIARATGTDFEQLRRLNSLADPNQLTVGQVLRLNASAPQGGAAPGSSAPVGRTPTPAPTPAQPQPLEPVQAKPQTPPETVSTPTPPPAADAASINLAWPIKGALIQTFNANTKGIDISGTPGDPIQAAADGKVMYIGNGVRGLGNLVIINHDNGFITVYGHNRTLLVKTGQQVKRGDRIAELGQTDTTSPRLHFEVRRRGTPVDPLRYLPAQ